MPSPNNKKAIELPGDSAMERRLKGVTRDTFMVDNFHSYIVDHAAGKTMTGPQIAGVFRNAVLACTKDVPAQGVAATLLLDQAEKYIRAIVDDEEVRISAIAAISRARRNM